MRVLLINILNNLQTHLSQSEEENFQGCVVAWQNFIHIVQLCEEMMYTSHKVTPPQNESQPKQINLNMNLLDWQSKHLMYIETGNEFENDVMQWAEWELLDSLFDGIEFLYRKFQIINDGEKMDLNAPLFKQSQYQVSTQIIQERVYETLERFYQQSDFDQDVQLLMRECLVGSQITPRGGNGAESQTQTQAVDSSQSSGQNRFNFSAGNRLKNLKLQFQQNTPSQNISQTQNASQQHLSQPQHCVVDSILNMLCTSLVESRSKDLVQKWLSKLE